MTPCHVTFVLSLLSKVSEKILGLDEECRQLHLHDAELVAKMEALARERSALMDVTEDLRAEIADKIALLDEFEDRFKRQYRSAEAVLLPHSTRSRESLEPLGANSCLPACKGACITISCISPFGRRSTYQGALVRTGIYQQLCAALMWPWR
jgi:hypothetical protein